MNILHTLFESTLGALPLWLKIVLIAALMVYTGSFFSNLAAKPELTVAPSLAAASTEIMRAANVADAVEAVVDQSTALSSRRNANANARPRGGDRDVVLSTSQRIAVATALTAVRVARSIVGNDDALKQSTASSVDPAQLHARLEALRRYA